MAITAAMVKELREVSGAGLLNKVKKKKKKKQKQQQKKKKKKKKAVLV